MNVGSSVVKKQFIIKKAEISLDLQNIIFDNYLPSENIIFFQMIVHSIKLLTALLSHSMTIKEI